MQCRKPIQLLIKGLWYIQHGVESETTSKVDADLEGAGRGPVCAGVEHGGDPRSLDRRSRTLGPQTKMCVADPEERKKWSKIAVTKLIRESGLSPTTVYKILEGKLVRCYILSKFKQLPPR